MSKSIRLLGGTLAALGWGAAIGTAWAAPVPVAAPFRVSQCTNCRQERPGIAAAASGAFLVVWEGSSALDLDGVPARVFTRTGNPRGGDVLLNADRPPKQSDATVAVDKGGNYVAVWTAASGTNSSDIWAQRFRSTGVPLTPAFKVSQDAPGTPTVPVDFNPAVAVTNDGGFVVVWISVLPPSPTFEGSKPAVLSRRFNAANQPVGAQVKLDRGLVHAERPDLCIDTSNRAVAVWATVDEFRPFESNKKGVSARRLTPAGAVSGAEVVVARPLARATEAAVACGKGNTFLVVWHSDQAPSSDRADILGQRFTRLNRPAGAPFVVNSSKEGDQRNPSVSMDAAGNFVAVWQGDVDDADGIYGRRFSATGVADGTDFQVVVDDEDATEPGQPEVAHIGKVGEFLVVWQDGNDGIFARRFKLSRAASGPRPRR
jgi:hypothetical protein